jgi:nitroimidazol reductase NimA-like FMN-containing flavoprotein (pyridoxamine 5'-phosphate oxidase superfamily)
MKLPPAPQPGELRDLALAVLAADRFPMLATMDGDQPRVRPVSPVKTDGFVVYVASMRSSNKTAEIERGTKVELCYLSGMQILCYGRI